MEFEKILSDLKNKVYHPVYFLMGEEPFFIDTIANFIEKNILDDSEKEFNQTVLYGGETNILQVIRGRREAYLELCSQQWSGNWCKVAEVTMIFRSRRLAQSCFK